MALARRLQRLETALRERALRREAQAEEDAQSAALTAKILAQPDGPALLAEWEHLRRQIQQEHGGVLTDGQMNRLLLEHPSHSPRYCQLGSRLIEIWAA